MSRKNPKFRVRMNFHSNNEPAGKEKPFRTNNTKHMAKRPLKLKSIWNIQLVHLKCRITKAQYSEPAADVLKILNLSQFELLQAE